MFIRFSKEINIVDEVEYLYKKYLSTTIFEYWLILI